MKPRLSLATTFLLALAASLAFNCSDAKRGTSSNSSASDGAAAMRPTLSFYIIPNCFLCADISDALGELEGEYGSKMNFRTVDYHFPASQEILHRFQLGSHGIIITSAEGEALWKMEAHHQGRRELEEAVMRITSGAPASPGG